MSEPNGGPESGDEAETAGSDAANQQVEATSSNEDPPGASDLIDDVSKRSDAPPASMLLDGVEFSQPSRSADIIQSDRSGETHEPAADDSED